MGSRYLLRRNGHYYLRLHVPFDLQPFFDGKRELKKSLGASKYNEARTLLRAHLGKAERLFTQMRSAMLTNTLTEEKIRELVGGDLKETLAAMLPRTSLTSCQGEGFKEEEALAEPEADADRLRSGLREMASEMEPPSRLAGREGNLPLVPSYHDYRPRAHVPGTIVAALAGHAQGSIDGDRYGKGYTASALLEGLLKMEFRVEEELRKLPKL